MKSRLYLIFPIFLVLYNVWNFYRINDNDRVDDNDSVRDQSSKSLVIPNESYLGFPVGSHENEVIEKLGPPTGYVALDSNSNAAIFGNSKAFIFTDKKLSGIRIGWVLNSFELREAYGGEDHFTVYTDYQLKNGITHGTSLLRVKELIGDKLTPSDEPSSDNRYHQNYQDGASTVHLFFSSTVGKEGDSAFSITGIMVVASR